MLKVPFSDMVRTAEANMTGPFKRSDEFSCIRRISVYIFITYSCVYKGKVYNLKWKLIFPWLNCSWPSSVEAQAQVSG